MKHKCYAISSSATDKLYIGYTSRALDCRLKQHLRDARNGSNCVLHRAIRRYGKDKFKIELLESFSSRHEALDAERRIISSLGTMAPGGYNMTLGGDGCVILCEESKVKKSESAKLRHADPDFKKRHREGCILAHDEARRKKTSDTHKGKKMHPNAAKAIAEVKKTDAYREIASKAAKRVWNRPGFKDKWIDAKRESHIRNADKFPIREDGLIFSSTRSAAEYMRENGFDKAAQNNISMACNGKYKSSCGYAWSWINGDEARKRGGII